MNVPNLETIELIEAVDALLDQVEDVQDMLCPSLYSRSTAEHRIATRLEAAKDLIYQCQAVLRHPSVLMTKGQR